MKFTDQQLKGNWGETYIATLLERQGCLVRTVSQGRDSGIDLYCETTYEGKPFLHFWVQVKTSRAWNKQAKKYKFNIGEKAKEKQLEMWHAQPVPVFIFLVPDIPPPDESPCFYICLARDFVEGNLASAESRFRIDPKEKALEAFLANELPNETYRWNIRKGLIEPIRKPQPRYSQEFIVGATLGRERQLYHNIRFGLQRLAYDVLEHGQWSDQAFINAKKLLEVCATFYKNFKYEGYESPFVQGAYLEACLQFPEAKNAYEEALNCIDNDPSLKDPAIVNEQESRLWEQHKWLLKQHINRVVSKIESANGCVVGTS